MDGTLTRETVKPFSNPRQSVRGLDAEAAAIVIAAASDISVIVDSAGVVSDVA